MDYLDNAKKLLATATNAPRHDHMFTHAAVSALIDIAETFRRVEEAMIPRDERLRA